MVTDSISDYFFTTTLQAGANLLKEGHDNGKIFFVGNTMIDSLLANLKRLVKPEIFAHENLENQPYLVATLHRPSNVSDPTKFKKYSWRLIDEHCGDARSFSYASEDKESVRWIEFYTSQHHHHTAHGLFGIHLYH